MKRNKATMRAQKARPARSYRDKVQANRRKPAPVHTGRPAWWNRPGAEANRQTVTVEVESRTQRG